VRIGPDALVRVLVCAATDGNRCAQSASHLVPVAAEHQIAQRCGVAGLDVVQKLGDAVELAIGE
jgi:hypothetical protein